MRRTLLVGFLWFSFGQGAVLAPPLACLFFLTRNRNYLVCLGTLLLSVVLNLAAPNPFKVALLPPDTLAEVYFDNLFVRLGYLPLLGQRWLPRVMGMDEASFLLVSTALLVLCLYVMSRAARIDSSGAAVLGVTVTSAMAIFAAIVLARSYGLAALRRPSLVFATRYDVMPGLLALVLIWTWVYRPWRVRGWRLPRYALLAWLTMNVIGRLHFQAPEPLLPFAWEWPAQAATIQAALEARREGTLREPVVVPVVRCRPWDVKTEIRIAP
jgi:hypothetical protein